MNLLFPLLSASAAVASRRSRRLSPAKHAAIRANNALGLRLMCLTMTAPILWAVGMAFVLLLGGCAAPAVQRHDVNVMWEDKAPPKIVEGVDEYGNTTLQYADGRTPAGIHDGRIHSEPLSSTLDRIDAKLTEAARLQKENERLTAENGVRIAALFSEPTPAEPLISIVGPTERAVGEMVVLTAKGESKGWSWTCAGKHAFEVADGGQRLFFCTPKPGEYEFILAGYPPEAVKPEQVSHFVTIRGGGPVPPPTPGPIPPDPEPVPPPVSPLNVLVREWAAKVNRPAEASKLAAVYDGVAWKINHGLSEPAQILAMTKEESRKALGVNASFWGEWAENLRQELNARAKAGPLDYASLWREVAAGLLPAGVKR